MVRARASDKDDDKAAPEAAPIPPETKFEAALAELESIVQNMEGGQLSLEESIAVYRRGSQLLRHCQAQLSDAERKIRILEEDTLRDLDPSRLEHS